MSRSRYRATIVSSLALLITCLPIGAAHAGDDPWPAIRESLFQDRTLSETTSSLQLFAPNQADDAALVPISIRLPDAVARRAKGLVLIVDRNPAPVAATFTFGDAFRAAPDVGERQLATRIRVDAFSRVRAVLETTDGKLEMVSRFVIGSGGCSAPNSKDPDAALASLGKTYLKVRRDSAHAPAWREIQAMIKHPNFTGLQMDRKTGTFTPALFVDQIEVRSSKGVLFRAEGGISLSEDPNIRLTMGLEEDASLEMSARDTQGRAFFATALPDPS